MEVTSVEQQVPPRSIGSRQCCLPQWPDGPSPAEESTAIILCIRLCNWFQDNRQVGKGCQAWLPPVNAGAWKQCNSEIFCQFGELGWNPDRTILYLSGSLRVRWESAPWCLNSDQPGWRLKSWCMAQFHRQNSLEDVSPFTGRYPNGAKKRWVIFHHPYEILCISQKSCQAFQVVNLFSCHFLSFCS